MPNFPNELSLKTLLSENHDADLNLIGDYASLYDGGSDFDIDSMIIKRKGEVEGCILGQLEERKRRAAYTNYAGGIIDGLVSEATSDTPRIFVHNGTDEQKIFWLNMNLDADGYGTPFATIFRECLKDELVSRRSYFEAIMVGETNDRDSIGISRQSPMTVLDWDKEWVKIHTVEYTRDEDNPFAASDVELHYFTFFSEDSTMVYQAKRKNDLWVDDNGKVVTEEKGVGKLNRELSILNHSFGIPIFDVRASKSQWVMDRIAPIIKSIYNAELDLNFSLSQSAYPQAVLTLNDDTRIDKIVKSEMTVFVLLNGEKFEYVSPQTGTFESQFKNIDRLKKSLHESLQLAAKEASSIPQAGRLSGEAIKEMRSPMESLLQSFVWPIKDAAMRCIDQIKKFRGEEDLIIEIQGLEPNVSEEFLRSIILGKGPEDGNEFKESNEEEENYQEEEPYSGEPITVINA